MIFLTLFSFFFELIDGFIRKIFLVYFILILLILFHRFLIERKIHSSFISKFYNTFKKAAEYISTMRQKNTDHQKDIDLLKKENKILEEKSMYFLRKLFFVLMLKASFLCIFYSLFLFRLNFWSFYDHYQIQSSTCS